MYRYLREDLSDGKENSQEGFKLLAWEHHVQHHSTMR